MNMPLLLAFLPPVPLFAAPPKVTVTKVSALISRLVKQLQDNLRPHPRARGRFAFSGELNAFP
jgi:hypothetical protein